MNREELLEEIRIVKIKIVEAQAKKSIIEGTHLLICLMALYDSLMALDNKLLKEVA